MRTIELKLIIAAALIATVAGCVSYTAALSKKSKPSEEKSFLYGRFSVDVKLNALIVISGPTIGFVVKNMDTSESYNFKFAETDTLQVIEVTPGMFALRRFVFGNYENHMVGDKPLQEGILTRPFKVEPGKAYYIADIEGSISESGSVRHWQIKSMTDNYEETTALFKSSYPNFSTIETIRAISPAASK